MRSFSILRATTLALALTASMGGMTAAFAASAAPAQQQQQQVGNTGPYDGPDFTVPANDIHN